MSKTSEFRKYIDRSAHLWLSVAAFFVCMLSYVPLAAAQGAHVAAMGQQTMERFLCDLPYVVSLPVTLLLAAILAVCAVRGKGQRPLVYYVVVFLLVFFAVFLFLLQNSFDLMASVYEVCGLAIDRVEALFGAGGALDLPEVSVVTTDDDIPSLIAMLVVSLISWVVVLAAYVVALVVCWARALQLYIMAAFAPIPLAFLGMDATRQIGLGYLKSFGAVCIAGVIILVLLISFPLVLGGLTGANPGTGTPADAVANGLTYALQYLAMCVLLILALVKSGSWARDIVSGF